MHDKKEYAIHVRNLKQSLHQGLILKKVGRVIKFNKKTSLKWYIDMNTELGNKMQKVTLKKIFFNLMNNEAFRKTKKNGKSHRDIKPIITKAKRNYLVLVSNYHKTFFFGKIICNRNKKK